MYNIEDSSFEEFSALCEHSIEKTQSSKETYEGYYFNKFTFNGEPLIIGGTIPVHNFHTDEDELFMCFAISKNIINHKRAVLFAGKDYFGFMAKQMPLCVMIEHNNDSFSKFAKHFGFEHTNFVEKNEESGIMYDVYIRR